MIAGGRRAVVASYRRLPLAKKVAYARRLAPIVWKCRECSVKVTTADQRGHAERRHRGRCRFIGELRPCARCGQPWRPWCGTKLMTHARCHFSAAEGDAIYERFAADPRLTQDKLAAELGIDKNVLRATLAAARTRRALKAGGC
jgi:hypothetical protein